MPLLQAKTLPVQGSTYPRRNMLLRQGRTMQLFSRRTACSGIQRSFGTAHMQAIGFTYVGLQLKVPKSRPKLTVYPFLQTFTSLGVNARWMAPGWRQMTWRSAAGQTGPAGCWAPEASDR